MEKKTEYTQIGLEVAVIAMSLRFPGARNVQEFWENLKSGVESIAFFSDQELEEAGVAPGIFRNPDYVKAGALLSDKDKFDAAFFGYIPGEAEIMDPQMCLFHECVWEAFETAGYDPNDFDGKIGFYAGAGQGLDRQVRAMFSESGRTMDPFELPHWTSKDFITSRISYTFNLRGPSLSIHTACSTSLVAVHMAYRALITGECDMAIAGGGTLTSDKKGGYAYREGMVLSPDGHCRAFDAKAEGTVGGEGIGIVVLKRLKKALDDGDTIYAMIKGSAVNNDGIRKMGYSAPGVDGQFDVVRKAHYMARFEPESITYMETHGTGTILGDPIEMKALTIAFDTEKRSYCAVGSVKTNVGHLDTAAGVAGFIKTVLALKHKMIPPSLHFQSPNPEIDFENSPFYVNTRLKAWENLHGPLRAGVSSFGIGGTNAHVALEEWTGNSPSTPGREQHLLLLSAKTETALETKTQDLLDYLENNSGQNPAADIADIAYTLQVGRRAFRYRRTMVCSDTAELITVLNAPRKPRTFSVNDEHKPIIFMFPGFGAQYIGMGRDLYEKEVLFREEMDNCFKLLTSLLDNDIKEVVYPPEGNWSNKTYKSYEEKINRSEFALPLIFAFEYALAKLLLKWGIQPYAMIGYSFGEYAAACISGVFSLEDALKLVVERGKLVSQTPEGRMLSIPLPVKKLRPLLGNGLTIAIDNGSSCIVGGTVEAVTIFEKEMKARRYLCVPLTSDRAIHSHLMDSILKEFEEFVGQVSLNKPGIPYISNVTGKWITQRDATSPGYWARHLMEAVRFADGIGELSKERNALFVEVGPGRDLSTLVKRHIEDKPDRKTINLVRAPETRIPDDYYLLDRIGRLWLHGVASDWQAFHFGEKRRRIALPTYPFERREFHVEGDILEMATELLNRQSQKGKKTDITDWFYVPVWEQTVSPALSATPSFREPPRHSYRLLFMDTSGLGAALLEQFKREGDKVIVVKVGNAFKRIDEDEYSVNPTEENDYDSLFRELLRLKKFPGRIIHLWSVSRPGGLEEAQNAGFYSLLSIARAAGNNNIKENLHIDVVSDNMQEVIGGDGLFPEKSTLLGAVKIIPVEYSNINCRSIDVLMPEPGSPEAKRLVAALCAEFKSDSGDHIIALRGNFHWRQSLKPKPLEKAVGPHRILKKKGVYLITGGFGGMGITLAEYLAETFSARLVLTGRSQFPNRENWDRWIGEHGEEDTISRKILKIKKLEDSGAKVIVFCADVADYHGMKDGICEVERCFGRVDGVFHTAGVADYAGVIQKRSRRRNDDILSSKLKGTLVLEQVLAENPPDFVVLFSSTAVVNFPIAFGQVGYVAANEFLDRFAECRNRGITPGEAVPQVISINWDTWRDVGMALPAAEIRAKEIGKTARELLRDAISPADGVEALLRVLDNGFPRMVISTEEPGSRVERLMRAAARSIEKSIDTEGAGRGVYRLRPEISALYLPPETENQSKLTRIWAHFFGIEAVGIDDDFFELGGDSLKAMNLIARIKKETGFDIPLSGLFKAPTVRQSALFIDGAGETVNEVVIIAEKREYYPQTSAQKRLFSLSFLEDIGTAYNLPSILKVNGSVDKKRLKTAVDSLIKRHETFRTSFELIGSEAVQIVHNEVDFEFEYYRTGYGFDVKDFIRPFDLSRAPLLRVGLMELSEKEYLLLYDMHHIIADGISKDILVRDFEGIYYGKELPALEIQYKDFAVWRNHRVLSGFFTTQEDYWKELFPKSVEIPKLDLPLDYPRPAVFNFEGGRYEFTLGAEETSRFRQMGTASDATLYMNLLAAFNVLLYKYTDQEDIIVGGVAAGRRHAELQDIIGMFVNTLAVRNRPRGDKTYLQFLEEVKENSLSAFENQDVQLETLVEHLNLERDSSRNPLFDVSFVMQNFAGYEEGGGKMGRGENRVFSPFKFDFNISQFDMALEAFDRGDTIYFSLEYCSQLFALESMQRFAGHFSNILRSIGREPGIQISDIELMTEEEYKQVLYEFNASGENFYEVGTVHELIENQAAVTPDTIAVASVEAAVIGYNELNAKAYRVALRLREKGFRPSGIAALLAERSIETVIGMLGILKAGGAYLPIDPDYPDDRIRYMLADSGTKFLLSKMSKFSVDIEGIDLNEIGEKKEYSSSLPTRPFIHSSAPRNLAYVIYTSGTTGMPKGVMVDHRSVINLVFWFGRAYGLGVGTHVLQMSSYTFDPSVEDVFSTLAHGSTLFTGSREIAVHRETFCDYVDTRQICLVNFIPSLLDELLCHERKLESLRIVVAGGERLEANIKNRIISMGYRLFNHYGPTEVTVDALTALCREDTPVTLGYPIANVECYILNSDRRPVPVGVTGELCIAGVGLARGYLNNPERTAERFPLAVGASFYRFLRTNNFYKTGDFARWLPDGNIQFIGRRDYQVKIRGHRVEPGEIETRLLSRRDIVDAVVTLKEGVSGVKYLCAYIVTADTFEDSGGVSALETYLSLRLPSYMVPMRFVRLERLPRDFNGKIDRKALPEPVVESNSDIFDAPVNHTEKILAIIWQDVLGVDKVGIRDNFFRLGGDSIKAIQVSARLKKHKLTLKLNDLFTFPTIEALGKRVLVSERIIDQGDVAGRVEFTPIQRWFFESDFSCKHHFNHSVMLYSKSGFDERFVQNVFSGIVRHHDALRMIYKNEDGRIVQINRGSRETGGTFFDFDVFDLIGKIDTAGKIEKEAGQIQASFNLETGPLVKLALFKTSEGDHLLIVIHHLVVDGVSWRILLEDFSSGYRQSMCEEKIEFPKKTDSFQYWADQLNVYARSREMMEESAYWDAVRLAAIESLPVDYQIGTVDRKIRYMDVVRLVLGKEETRQLLTDVHKPYNTEINDILLSVLAMAIREWSGCRRIAVNLESHGREQISDTDVSRTVGWFTSQFPVILDSTSVEDISHHIKNVKETLRRIPHGGIGYGLSTYLSPRKQSRDASFFREPEINFNYLGQMNPGRNGSFFSLSVINTGEVVNTDMESVYLLDINGLVIDETLSISFNYFANEYKRDTIRQLADYYRNNLITVIHHCIGKEDEELTPSDVGDEELSFEELEEIREMINL